MHVAVPLLLKLEIISFKPNAFLFTGLSLSSKKDLGDLIYILTNL